MKKLTLTFILSLCTTALFAQESITLTPNSGPAAGGTTVTLSGALGGCPIVPPCAAPTVRFGNSAPITATEVTGTQVTVRTPTHEAGTVDVLITTRNGSTVTLPKAFTFVANSYAEWERIIVPVAVKGQAGALNSVWTTDLSAYNAGANSVLIEDCIVEACHTTPIVVPPLTAGRTRYFNYANGFDEPATILWVKRNEVSQLRFTARFRDTARVDQTYGTELPLVRESDLTAGPVHLIDIPTDRRFRVNLRVYDIDSLAGNEITIRAHSMDGDETRSMAVPIRLFKGEEQTGEFYGFAAVSLDAFLGQFTRPYVRVEAIPSNPSSRLWGFISVTNNQTQQVTIISPQ